MMCESPQLEKLLPHGRIKLIDELAGNVCSTNEFLHVHQIAHPVRSRHPGCELQLDESIQSQALSSHPALQ